MSALTDLQAFDRELDHLVVNLHRRYLPAVRELAAGGNEKAQELVMALEQHVTGNKPPTHNLRILTPLVRRTVVEAVHGYYDGDHDRIRRLEDAVKLLQAPAVEDVED